MEINEVVKEAHETATKNGWWETPRNPLEVHMLIVSEVAEATEWARKREPDEEAEELADAVIRIADYFGYKKWDLEKILRDKMDFNKTRSYRHGGKAF